MLFSSVNSTNTKGFKRDIKKNKNVLFECKMNADGFSLKKTEC
jgi:hypothetical protein